MPEITQDKVGEYWQLTDLRQAQAKQAIAELQLWQNLDVYTVFVDVGRKLVAAGHTTLIDVGAGAGQYGMLWLSECGGKMYFATNHEWEPEYYDLITPIAFSAGSIEYDQNPHAIVTQWAESMWGPIIFHRLRFQDEPASRVLEASYFGAMVPMWRWNRAELDALLVGRHVEKIVWPHNPTQETWVVT
jgi:hypothetical protein